MQDYEQLGAFYLGSGYDLGERKRRPELVLYDSRHLTTHALCVGMTGSGKTGLCIGLLEEADTDVGTLTLVWLPFRRAAAGDPSYAFSLV